MKIEFIDPGALRAEMRLMQPVAEPDGMGGRTESWTEAATVFARIEPRRASSTFGAGQAIETITHRITMRWRSDVTAGLRLVRGERTFEIVTVSDPDESGRYIVVEARERLP